MDFIRKLLMVEIITKIKLRVLNFRYVIAINMTIMYINSQTNLWVSLKVIAKLTLYCSK